MNEVICEVRDGAGLITLARPQALNALSLDMIRALREALDAWEHDARVRLVAIRGTGRDGPFGAFCAGGDIRFFHRAALAGDPRLEDFFTEEYALNHRIHVYPKPYVAFMDGIVMGGGMGIVGHGGAHTLRIATERAKVAMPETNIGLFPDVGGGWFLARCPGRIGEYLGLTGDVIGGHDACVAGLADGVVAAAEQGGLWERLASPEGPALVRALRERFAAAAPDGAHGELGPQRAVIDRCFGQADVRAILSALEAEGSLWATRVAGVLRKRSPLMMNVTLRLIRQAATMALADELRLERDLVRHCFHLRPGAASETVEGIRALVVDKDHSPRWNPARLEDVTPQEVEPFFASPWPASMHPLRDLA